MAAFNVIDTSTVFTISFWAPIVRYAFKQLREELVDFLQHLVIFDAQILADLQSGECLVRFETADALHCAGEKGPDQGIGVTKSRDSLEMSERDVSSMICPISLVMAVRRLATTATVIGSTRVEFIL